MSDITVTLNVIEELAEELLASPEYSFQTAIALDQVKEIVQRQEPQPMREEGFNLLGVHWLTCPKCRETVSRLWHWCPNCGQAIVHEEVK